MIIEVKNTPDQKINLVTTNHTQDIGVKQDIVIVPVMEDVPKYEGTYDVTPKVEEQTLPTAEKFLEKDVTIKKIPYFEVSNTSGGDTVYIGNEV